jgi:predicted Zn-ribbon and HTH transcriptional regulator
MALPGVEQLEGLGLSHSMAQGVLVGVAVLLVVFVLSRLLKPKPSNPHLLPARCQSCGWTGSVSKFKPICPKCANKIAL